MKAVDFTIRDPFILPYEGVYYLYASNYVHDFIVYTSRDLENWTQPVKVTNLPGDFWATKDFWAPEVHFYRGSFYLFATMYSEHRNRGTQIFKSASPIGPFVPISDGPATPADWMCLDGTLFVEDGKPYMVFCHEWVQAGDGEVNAIPLTDDLRAPAGEPRLLFHASDAKWCQVKHHSSGVSGCVTDGPFLWRTADGTLLCLWASFSEGGYTEGVAVSDNGEIDGKFTQVEPLFMDDGGHGMVFRALDGQLYLTLHSPNAHLEERPFFHPITERAGRLHRN